MTAPRPPRWFVADDILAGRVNLDGYPFRYIYVSIPPAITTPFGGGDYAARVAATGAQLRDVNGEPVGKITAVASDGATVDTGQTKVKLPLDAFGVDASGLVIGITLQKLDEIIAQADAAAGKKK